VSTWKKSTWKKVDGERRRRVDAEEPPPAEIAAAGRRRRYPGPLQDPADRRGGDPMTELSQLALQALVSPRGIVPGQLLDQRGDLLRHQPHDQRGDLFGQRRAAMPAQDRTRRDQPVILHPTGSSRINPARTARSAQSSRRWVPAPQERDLVPQHQQFSALSRARAGEQHQPGR
jgi:hypothetical protein